MKKWLYETLDQWVNCWFLLNLQNWILNRLVLNLFEKKKNVLITRQHRELTIAISKSGEILKNTLSWFIGICKNFPKTLEQNRQMWPIKYTKCQPTRVTNQTKKTKQNSRHAYKFGIKIGCLQTIEIKHNENLNPTFFCYD